MIICKICDNILVISILEKYLNEGLGILKIFCTFVKKIKILLKFVFSFR
jgi:hypothetical protein